MYKVGDEVLVKAKIIGIDEFPTDGLPYEVGTEHHAEGWVAEDEIIAYKTYSQGLADAWEMARKICHEPKKGGLSNEELSEIFGTVIVERILERFTAEEALAKIEAYEREKEIKVGDVVVKTSGAGSKYIGVVTQITDAQYSVCLVFSDGSTETTVASNLTKTGKHIDIEGLLRQIGE